MDITKYIYVVAIVAVCVAAVCIVKMVLEYKERQNQRDRDSFDRVMSTPLEKFGDTDAERLAKKYETSSQKSTAKTNRSTKSAYDDENDDRYYRNERARNTPLINISINNTSHSNNTHSETYSGNARRSNVYKSDGLRGGSSPKSRFVAFGLCFFLGIIGVHHFYCGKTGMGLLYLFTGGLFCMGWIVDIFRIGFGSYRDADGRLLR